MTSNRQTEAGLLLSAQLAAAQAGRNRVEGFLQLGLHLLGRRDSRIRNANQDDRKAIVDDLMEKLGTYAKDDELRKLVQEVLWPSE